MHWEKNPNIRRTSRLGTNNVNFERGGRDIDIDIIYPPSMGEHGRSTKTMPKKTHILESNELINNYITCITVVFGQLVKTSFPEETM